MISASAVSSEAPRDRGLDPKPRCCDELQQFSFLLLLEGSDAFVHATGLRGSPVPHHILEAMGTTPRRQRSTWGRRPERRVWMMGRSKSRTNVTTCAERFDNKYRSTLYIDGYTRHCKVIRSMNNSQKRRKPFNGLDLVQDSSKSHSH